MLSNISFTTLLKGRMMLIILPYEFCINQVALLHSPSPATEIFRTPSFPTVLIIYWTARQGNGKGGSLIREALHAYRTSVGVDDGFYNGQSYA